MVSTDKQLILYVEETDPKIDNDVQSVDMRILVNYNQKESRYIVRTTRCPINKCSESNRRFWSVNTFRFSRSRDVVKFIRTVCDFECQFNNIMLNAHVDAVEFDTVKSYRSSELVGYENSDFNSEFYENVLDLMISES
jgi:hypothetical protein